MDPEEIQRLAARIGAVYEAAERDAMEAVSRRLARGIEDPGWAAAKQAEMAAIRRELQAGVASLNSSVPGALEELLDNAHRAGAQAAAASIGADTVVPAASRRAVQFLAQEVAINMAATHFGILRQSQDVYRSVIADVAGSGVAGGATRRVVAQRALSQWADRGITGFTDRAGRKWQLDSYAEMSTRTAINRAHLEGRAGKLTDNGKDLVIVTDSPDECPLCRPWEGKVLSLSGRTEGYPRLDDARGSGLFHPGCTHTFSAYVEGLSRIMSPRETQDAAGYQERQRQRHLEAQVRRWKRRGVTAITPAERALTRSKVRDYQAELRAHLAVTGRRRNYARESIPRVSAAKAVPKPSTIPVPVQARSVTPREMDRLMAHDDYPLDELEALNTYTTPEGYRLMNGRLRGTLDDDAARQLLQESSMSPMGADELAEALTGVDEVVDSLRSATLRHELPENLTLMRGTGGSSFGFSREQVAAGIPEEDVARLVGNVYTEPGFLSTSVVGDLDITNNRSVVMEITAPKGTRAMWAEPFSEAAHESEVLLAPGSRFVVTSATTTRTGPDGGQLLLRVTVLP